MEPFSYQVFSPLSPFSFISRHLTTGYFSILIILFILFIKFVWGKLDFNNSILLLVPFTPLFSYFFYASSNIAMILYSSDRAWIGLLWVSMIPLTGFLSFFTLKIIRKMPNLGILGYCGKTFFLIQKSNVSLVLFFLMIALSLYLAQSDAVTGFNSNTKVLFAYGGGWRKYLTSIFIEPFLLIFVGTLIINSNKFSKKLVLVVSTQIIYTILLGYFGGSKGFIVAFLAIASVVIYKFSLHLIFLRGFMNFKFSLKSLPIPFFFVVIVCGFLLTPLRFLVLYVIEYFFVSPIECTSVVILENIDPHSVIGADYFTLLLEPFHKFGLGIKQYNSGNAINYASSYLPDLKYGGTNPSVFCQSLSSDSSVFFIPVFWSLISGIFIGFTKFLCLSLKNNQEHSFLNIIPRKDHSRYTFIGLLSFFVYMGGTPQASWLEWFIQSLYSLMGMAIWLVIFSMLRKS